MDAFYDSIDKSMAHISAITIEGRSVEVDAVEYSIVREAAPIYTMGTPMPISFTRSQRHVSGTLYIGENELLRLMRSDGDTFDIYIENEGNKVVLERVDIIEDRYIAREQRYICQFICQQGTERELVNLEKLSKRELAKKLLDKEY